jgi:HPt (histidine-containing phosphotransfer) domain-containing protein
MQADEFACAGSDVQIVDVLRDETEPVALRPPREYVVRRIGTARGDLLPPPGIPFPDQYGITCERDRRREILGPVSAPQSVRTAKCRHAARRGHAGARHRRHTTSRGDARREIIQGRIRHNLHVPGFNAAELFEEYGDEALVRELAQLLIDTTPAQLDAIRSAVATSDAMALRAAAHRLRGSIVAFDVPDAVETARTLEAMGSTGNLTGAEALSTSLARDVQSLRERAAAWLNSDAQSANG